MAEPGAYAVDDLPVTVERDPAGRLHARALDLRTGAFFTDAHYLALADPARRGVEPLSPAAFARLVAVLRTVVRDDLEAVRLVWHRDGEGRGYRSEHEGRVFRVRPDGAHGTLVVDGQDVARLHAWPANWSRGIALREVLHGLIGLTASRSTVDRQAVLTHLSPRATATTTSGPDLAWPAWADRTGGATDVFVELGGPVAGARVPEPRHGQYVDLFSVGCAAVDVEAVTGPLKPAVKVHYDDPDRSLAYLTANGQNLRIIVETRPGRETMVVTVHFP
ncbi:MAG: hypothetical protein ACLGI2_10135 [Acidimicrobiia bacterium]